MAYLPIEQYGAIGDMHTVALVGTNGSIDWYCSPRFDAPSVFARILDADQGGYFSIAPTGADKAAGNAAKQLYWPDSNVLITRFVVGSNSTRADTATSVDTSIGELIDFMPVQPSPPSHDDSDSTAAPGAQIIRIARAVHGTVRFRMRCIPAFDYARSDHQVVTADHGVCFRGADLDLGLRTAAQLHSTGGGVSAEFVLQAGESMTFVLGPISSAQGEPDLSALPDADQAQALLMSTVSFWQDWLSTCTYRGRWREIVTRSALTLKLMTYKPTGAIVAAPTTSLPEWIGGGRNWDYRYTWIRDASFTAYSLLLLGFRTEAEDFFAWVEARAKEVGPGGVINIMYTIEGNPEIPESHLDHLSGYRDSRPVRIGNGAYLQRQLDITGELLDTVWCYETCGGAISHDFWYELRRIVDWTVENWQHPDEGMWEVRGDQQHFVSSKLMCWVALDRGLRIADKRAFPADTERWRLTRDVIYEQIMSRGWNPELAAFTQYYGGDELDASNLLIPLMSFLAPGDPRTLSHLQATMRSPAEGGLLGHNMVYRYLTAEDPSVHNVDGLEGEEGSFTICTFWLIEALARAGQFEPAMLSKAHRLFDEMLTYANHLGLYAEEIGPGGEALGNSPQAFPHLALIRAALALDEVLPGGDSAAR